MLIFTKYLNGQASDVLTKPEDDIIEITELASGRSRIQLREARQSFETVEDIDTLVAQSKANKFILITPVGSTLRKAYFYPDIETMTDYTGGRTYLKFRDSRRNVAVVESQTAINAQVAITDEGGDGNRRGAVIDFVDNTSTAPVLPSIGDRYILDSTGATDPSWGAAAPNSIVEWDGVQWVATIPKEGWTAYVDAADEDVIYEDDGVPGWKFRGAMPIVIGNTIYVSESGDDATAVVNRIDKPYRHIVTAVAAASAGDVIKWYAGSYDIGGLTFPDNGTYRLVKNQVKIECEGKVVLTHLTSATVSQLWSDDGNVMDFTIEGDFTFTGIPSGFEYLTAQNANSRYKFDITEWYGERIALRAYKSFIFKADTHRYLRQGLSVRLNQSLDDTTFVYEVNTAWQTTVAAFTSFEYNRLGFGIFLTNSSITHKVKYYKYGYAFNPLGNVFFGNIFSDDCNVVLDMPQIEQTGTNNMFGIPLLYAEVSNAVDVDMNFGGIKRYGLLMNALTDHGLRGRIRFQGECLQFSPGSRNYITSVGSQRLTIDVDMECETPLNKGFFFGGTSGSPKNFLTGKVLWNAFDATSHVISLSNFRTNPAGVPHPSIQNFVAEINGGADIIGDGTGTPTNPIDIVIHDGVSTNQIVPAVAANYVPRLNVVQRDAFVQA